MTTPSRRILIVDDEPDLAEIVARRIAAQDGYEVMIAHDGEEGWTRAVYSQPSVILLDLAMPGLDGWGLCRRLHSDPRTRAIPLVIMTAWMTPGLERRALAEGVTRLLIKPFEERDLAKALDSTFVERRPEVSHEN